MRKTTFRNRLATAGFAMLLLLETACTQQQSSASENGTTQVSVTQFTTRTTTTTTTTTVSAPQTTITTEPPVTDVPFDPKQTDPPQSEVYQYQHYKQYETESDEEVELPPAEYTAPATTKKPTVTTTRVTKATNTVKPQTTVTTTVNYTKKMNTLIRNYPRNCAILLTCTDGTTLFSYQPNVKISGASLIKLPYVYYCCTQLTNGVRSLSETMTYTSSWYHGGSGIIRKNGYGKKYTIAQLLDYALRYSDNVAYDMLVYLFGIHDFNSMVDSWGYSVHISETTRFPAVTASFMQTAMQKMHDSSQAGECWKIAWDALLHSQKSYVRDTIGGEIAVKYGSIPAQYHEVCFVNGDPSYILVILSGAVNYTPDVKFVQNTASCMKNMMDQYTEAKHTTTVITTTTSTTVPTTAITTTFPSEGTDTTPVATTAVTTTSTEYIDTTMTVTCTPISAETTFTD